MRVEAQTEISAPQEAVWEWVSDPTRDLQFMSGVTRWEVVGVDEVANDAGRA